MNPTPAVLRVFEHSKACRKLAINSPEMSVSKSEAEEIASYFKYWDDERVSSICALEKLVGSTRERQKFPLSDIKTLDGSLLYGVKIHVVGCSEEELA